MHHTSCGEQKKSNKIATASFVFPFPLLNAVMQTTRSTEPSWLQTFQTKLAQTEIIYILNKRKKGKTNGKAYQLIQLNQLDDAHFHKEIGYTWSTEKHLSQSTFSPPQPRNGEEKTLTQGAKGFISYSLLIFFLSFCHERHANRYRWARHKEQSSEISRMTLLELRDVSLVWPLGFVGTKPFTGSIQKPLVSWFLGPYIVLIGWPESIVKVYYLLFFFLQIAI